ncbi:MAG: hypothetical protein MUP58_01375 [Candidatus Nanohaloarchaeota archaeon QJJ-9]|nr:hypothetical protein [Candidatus Nanohaloarchaeota archaeon QJJ-9]
MSDRNDTYWIVEIIDGKASLSVASEEEAEAHKEIEDIEDWMIESTRKATKKEMVDRIEDHDLEFDPWL